MARRRRTSSLDASSSSKRLLRSTISLFHEDNPLSIMDDPTDFKLYADASVEIPTAQSAYDAVYRVLKKRSDVATWIRLNHAKIQKSTNNEEKHMPASQNIVFYAQYRLLEKQMDSQIAIYGKRSCLELCRAMAAKLPRELRNLVHENLTASSSPISADDHRVTYAESGYYGFEHSDFLSKQIFAYPAFVGREHCQEILETYLHRNTFRLNDSYKLGGFLRTAEPFVLVPGAPFLAPIDFVRHLIIKIRGDAMKPLPLPDLNDLEDANFANFRWGYPGHESRPPDKLVDSLEPLLLIKNPNGFRLQLFILANNRETLESILEGMRPIYSRLKDAGFKAEVTFGTLEKVHYVEHLTGFFECSREDWDAKIEAYFELEPDLDIKDISDIVTRALVRDAKEKFPGWSVRYLIEYTYRTEEEPVMLGGVSVFDLDLDDIEGYLDAQHPLWTFGPGED